MFHRMKITAKTIHLFGLSPEVGSDLKVFPVSASDQDTKAGLFFIFLFSRIT